ncbi:HNH endonuclease [Luedemannella helvata]|uniref:HNH endonuclease n=2 Tax=Luedemannella helvata TaxID=349315 RepID=A0ABN2KG27_9ACTN
MPSVTVSFAPSRVWHPEVMTASPGDTGQGGPLDRLARLRQHERGGRRSPHKPLLVLLALGRLHQGHTDGLTWQDAQQRLADLITEYGPASRTRPAQSAAYPFTRLRSDAIWVLDADVPMDDVGPLNRHNPVGRFTPELQTLLHGDPDLVRSTAHALAEAHFPATVAADVLADVGFDPDLVLTAPDVLPDPTGARDRRRDPAWRHAILQAWDLQCAFCGYDGQILGTTVGVEAAHVRWFSFDGPDSLDNGLALCVLHHKLFDRGVIGLDHTHRIDVTTAFRTSTDAGRAIYALHGRHLQPRPGTQPPATDHIAWHRREVFKGTRLPT